MLQITKIFHFEMAHAILGYNGACKNIHGHSYELHVTVSSVNNNIGYVSGNCLLFDFKEIKKLVKNNIIEYFDHKMILSEYFIFENP